MNIAGISPKSIELTGEIADGSLPLNYGPRGLKEVVDGISRGAQRAGRDPKEVSIALIMHCCVCPDRAVALRSVKGALANYGSLPFYNRLFVRQGFVKEAAGDNGRRVEGRHGGRRRGGFRPNGGGDRGDGHGAGVPQKTRRVRRAGASYVLLYPVPIEGSYDRGARAVLDAFGS